MTRQASGSPIEQEASFLRSLVDRIEALEKIAHVHQDDLRTLLTYPRFYQVLANGEFGPCTGPETIMDEIDIPAQPIPTQQIVSCWFNTTGHDGASDPGDRMRMRVRDEDLTGNIRGAWTPDYGTDGTRFPLSVPSGQVRTVAADTAVKFVMTVEQIVGSNGVANLPGNPAYFAVWVIPDHESI